MLRYLKTLLKYNNRVFVLCYFPPKLLAGVWEIIRENSGYSLQTQECGVNLGLAEGR